MKALKILFADDDLKYALILKRFLEAEGYEVYYAGNGRIALEQYPEVKPDLILLDINMPEVNGYEVARRIRETDKQTLIFFLTDRTDKTDRLEGRRRPTRDARMVPCCDLYRVRLSDCRGTYPLPDPLQRASCGRIVQWQLEYRNVD